LTTHGIGTTTKMTKQYSIPPVGANIRVTTRYREINIFAKSEWRDTVYEGVVINPDKWTALNAFNLACPGESRFPIHEINLSNVHDLQMLDGTTAEKVDVDNSVKSIKVAGSGGNVYNVTKVGNKITCTCPGFTFRNKCKHTAMI